MNLTVELLLGMLKYKAKAFILLNISTQIKRSNHRMCKLLHSLAHCWFSHFNIE
jgi:hypothetical protein